MEILRLPNELLLLIVENLSVKDLSRLLLANRRLSSVLTPHLHSLALQDVGTLTALQWAATHGHVSLAEFVISNGAEVDKPDLRQLGQTALHAAAAHDHPDVIRLLAKHGARIAATDAALQTPLHRAVVSWSPGAARALLELGANMTCTDKWGETPARGAAYWGGINCMRAFVDAGLDFSHKDAHGRTILHDAIISGANMVEYLLGNGGRQVINARDFTGATPLHEALTNSLGDERVVRLLLRHGADTEVKDNQGHTPLDYDALYGGGMFTKVLLECRAKPLDCE